MQHDLPEDYQQPSDHDGRLDDDDSSNGEDLLDLLDEDPGEQVGRSDLTIERGIEFRSAVGFGDGLTANRDVNVHNYFGTSTRPPPPVVGPVDDKTLDRLAETYFKVPEFDWIKRRLLGHRVQVLQGQPGTGRMTTALLVIRALRKQVCILQVPDDPATLIGSLEGGVNYVMVLDRERSELGSQLTVAVLHGLRQHLGDIDAYLVIVAEPAVLPDNVASQEFIVSWSPPPGERVLEKHLGQAAAGIHRELDARPDLRKAIYEEAKQASGPGSVVAFVDQIGEKVRQGRPIELIVSGFASRLRKEVREWLLEGSAAAPASAASTPVDPAREPVAERSLWDIATLIACCVFNGYPLARVSAAAVPLAMQLHDLESPGLPPPRPVLRDSIAACDRFIRVTGPDEPGPDWFSRLHTPRVYVRDPRLPRIVLEEVWRRLTAAREPVTRWLRDLVVSARRTPIGRERSGNALRAIGLLAQIDFDDLYRHVLGAWADSPSERTNKAAADALEIASTDDRAAPTVRIVLRQWSRDNASPRRRRTALLAYATSVGSNCPAGDVLRAVRNAGLAAEDPLVMFQFARLAADGRAHRVLTDLSARVDNGDLPALKQFMVLARPGDPEGIPDLRAALLSASATSQAHEAALAHLWAWALQDPSTRVEAWQRLRAWVALGAHQPELLERLGALIGRLLAEPYVAPRLQFVLRLWWGSCAPPERSALTILSRAAPMETGGGR
jgi:hypothetical protein